ncbi:DUF4231 domain-containing protein [Sphingomonas glacialis]|uniref:DUF4231 domain-containing protein n=1 Tax=Sphingomonas glacialis TaxID=658225 RepID=A0A502FAL2_9SPHN|nr:DUF4231 domain-containing protein [Sphingomonas glacialis]TPG46455.1 hypothetical protein EAH76_23480 [Sphingomonas glacialis]
MSAIMRRDHVKQKGTGVEPLTIGVTGHRPSRLAGVDLTDLAARVRVALSAFAAAAPGHELRLVSNLAEGADSIAFDQAAALGWPVDVVLPFEPMRNAYEFPDPAARAALDARLAGARVVMALAPSWPGREAPEVAYERAGRVMLAQSDVLLAIWDGAPARGRGGAAQIIEEAVARGIPVIHVPVGADASAPRLLWDRLDALHLGQAELETVPMGGLNRLPDMVAHLVNGEADGALPPIDARRRPTLAVAYSLLLQLTGVRRLRRADFRRVRIDPTAAALIAPADPTDAFRTRINDIVSGDFAIADAVATEAARRFRSAYVSNFTLAATAVLIALAGLLLPISVKPVLICLELATIATILVVTRLGNRSRWHQRWLDARRVAEQLRCLAIAAQLGDLHLRRDLHPAARAVARRLGMPAVVVDDIYLTRVHADLLRLLDGQIAYLDGDAHRMHRLEHRLHRVGGLLFGLTATICLVFLVIELAAVAVPALHGAVEPITIWGTVSSAALPAIGAAIYGIRMQGDFAGTAERDEELAGQLRRVRALCGATLTSYDALRHRTDQIADLLTQDLSSWLQTYVSRPLVLPG